MRQAEATALTAAIGVCHGCYYEGVIILIFELCAMLATGLTLGKLARRMGLPSLVGEMAAGFALGPTLLGTMEPRAYGWLFPGHSSVFGAREALINFGLLIFLFGVGSGLGIGQVGRLGRRIVWTSLGGMLLPFGLGVAGVTLLPGLWHAPPGGDRHLTALFIGTALSISALPVIGRILRDLDLIGTDVGMVVMSAATLDDIAGWSVFAVLLLSAGHRGGNPALAVATVVVLLAAALAVGRSRALLRIVDKVHAAVGIAGIVGLVLAMAWVTGSIGLGGVFGAFLAGIALVAAAGREPAAHRALDRITTWVFAPLYFVSVGLQIDLRHDFAWEMVLLTIAIATVGKVVGATAGAWIGGAPPREALAVGFGLNARGAMGIVLASTALQDGLIGRPVFVAIVTMALVTSIISGPAMLAALGKPKTVSPEAIVSGASQ